MAKNAYEVVLPGDRTVVLVELGTGQVEQAMTLAGTVKAQAAREFRTGLEGLRLSVREIDGRKVTYEQLEGAQWDDHFSMRETMLLIDAWNLVHMPTDEETLAGRGKLKAISAGSGT